MTIDFVYLWSFICKTTQMNNMLFDMINFSEAIENEIVAKSKSNSNIWIYLENFWQTVNSVLTSILFNTDNNHMSY